MGLAKRKGIRFVTLAIALGSCAAIFTLRSAAVHDSPQRVQHEGTRRMAERLKDFADHARVQSNSFLSEERADLFGSIIPPSDPQVRLKVDQLYARELLNAGRTEEALERLKELWQRLDADPSRRDSEFGLEVHGLLALAYLRLGEQENCIQHHGTESCLMPIRGSGVHTEQRGSRAAIREYTDILTRHPEDLASRWLLNVAYMTVGEYPKKVPAAWLIPPRVFKSERDIGRFHDVAARVGLVIDGWAGGAIMEDFDADGYLDVMVSSWRLRDQIRLFRNDRDGSFSERTDEAGLTGIIGGLNAVQADYDNDGYMDVFVPRGAWLHEDGLLPPSLLHNNGDGTFDDVTEQAGMLSFGPTQAAAWGDYDNDGWVDLFVGHESLLSEPPHPCQLYHNNHDGTFTEVGQATGVSALGYFKGAVWGDYDNDGLLDLYVTAIEPKPSNILFHNEGSDGRGGWGFRDVSEQAGVLEPAHSFPTWFFDYDNDGWLDIFVSGYAATIADVAADYLGLPNKGEKPRLYHNNHDGTFTDVSHAARVDKVVLTMGCNFGDLDNDGWLDFYLGTGNPEYRTLDPARMFRNAGGRFFEDVTTSGGFGHLQKGHGVAFGDLDNDGDQDIFFKIGGAFAGDRSQSVLFENPGHGNHWITLKLVGVQSNRAAIGARIKVTIEERSGTRDVHVTVTSGSSFGSSSLRQEIGLGQAVRVRRIEITWPASGRVQILEDVAPDQILEIREDDPQPVPLRLERLHLS